MMLSSVERDEQIRQLPLPQRTFYHTATLLLSALLFLLALGVAVGLALLLARVLVGVTPSVPVVMVLALPVTLATMLAIGMAAGLNRETTVPGQNMRRVVFTAMRSGLVFGVMIGLIFGILWQLIFRIEAMYWERWAEVFQSEVLTFAAILAAAVGLTTAAFRGLTSILDTAILRLVRR